MQTQQALLKFVCEHLSKGQILQAHQKFVGPLTVSHINHVTVDLQDSVVNFKASLFSIFFLCSFTVFKFPLVPPTPFPQAQQMIWYVPIPSLLYK